MSVDVTRPRAPDDWRPPPPPRRLRGEHDRRRLTTGQNVVLMAAISAAVVMWAVFMIARPQAPELVVEDWASWPRAGTTYSVRQHFGPDLCGLALTMWAGRQVGAQGVRRVGFTADRRAVVVDLGESAVIARCSPDGAMRVWR